jgi:hypothetical protein
MHRKGATGFVAPFLQHIACGHTIDEIRLTFLQ